MVGEDSFVELAKLCTRACRAVKTVTEGRDADTLSGPSKKKIEDLARCVDPAQPSLSIITRDIRTIRHIESAVRERANCPCDLRQHHPGPSSESSIAWRTELWEILSVCEVRRRQLTTPKFSQPPQGDLGRGGASEVSKIEQDVQRSVDVVCSFVALGYLPC